MLDVIDSLLRVFRAFVEHWAPVVETLVWAALIVWLVRKFYRPLLKVLITIQRRIAAGHGFETPWLKFPAASAQDQIEKKQEEVSQLLEAQAPPAPPANAPVQTPLPQEPTIKWESSTVVSKDKRERLFARVSEAENLAINALQAKVGVPISRNVSLAPRYIADGVFEENGRLTVVEVKYITSLTLIDNIIPRAIHQVRSAIGRMRRRDFLTAKAVIVLVVSHSRLVQPLKDLVEMQYTEMTAERVKFEVFSLYALRREFGFGAGTSEVDDPDLDIN
jgi:hypothetical protein